MRIGLDVGINSLGYAVISNGALLDANSHIFEKAEEANGDSLALNRRNKRALRRVIRRRGYRLHQIRELLQIPKIQPNTHFDKSPWELRAEGLNRLLSQEEWARVLLHIAKRRGFQSTRKGGRLTVEALEKKKEGKNKFSKEKALEAYDKKQKEELALLKDIEELEKNFKSSDCETIGQYFCQMYQSKAGTIKANKRRGGEVYYTGKVRNGSGQYGHTPYREEMVRAEVAILFERQRSFGNLLAQEAIENQYSNPAIKDFTNKDIGIAFYQRALQSTAHMVGECTFLQGEKRAPKHSFHGEMFLLYSALRKLRLNNPKQGERTLTLSEEQKILSVLQTKEKITFAEIRTLLDLTTTTDFNIYYAGKSKKGKKEEPAIDLEREKQEAEQRKEAEKKSFASFSGIYALQKATGLVPFAEEPIKNLFDEIAWILTTEKEPARITEALTSRNLSPEAIEKCLLCANTFKTHISLSIKAIKTILPEMVEGRRYDEAKEGRFPEKKYTRFKTNGTPLPAWKAGMSYATWVAMGGEGNPIPPIKDITNPIVARALGQARKVLFAILREYKNEPIEHISIELARELGKSKKERDEITDRQQENAKNNLSLREEFSGKSETDFLKFKLWKEQQGHCAYYFPSKDWPSPYIPVENILSPEYEIDHILPLSRSHDNGYMNKVLCRKTENQNKGSRTPYEKWGATPHWQYLEDFAKRLPRKKRDNFLMVDFGKREGEFKERHLNDTRYIATALKDHLAKHLKVSLRVTSGRVTSHLRYQWGFGKKLRRQDDTHHAQDAIIIACTTDDMIEKITKLHQERETSLQRPAKLEFPLKTEDVNAKLNTLFVSRQPSRKVTGAAHEETIRSDRRDRGLGVVETKRITTINLKTLERMVEKDVRNNKLYQVLKARLEAHNDKPDVAFAEPAFHEYLQETWTAKAPRITSLKLISSEASGIAINGGLASNGGMVRVDVFTKPNKKTGKQEYYLCPVYVADYVKATLPNKVMVPLKKEEEWLEIDDSYTFLFQLYKNDVVKISKGDGTIIAGYYNGADRATSAINLLHHDGSKLHRGIGVKTLVTFEKYSVDYFGNRTLIKKETRHELAHRRRKPKGAPLAKAEPASS